MKHFFAGTVNLPFVVLLIGLGIYAIAYPAYASDPSGSPEKMHKPDSSLVELGWRPSQIYFPGSGPQILGDSIGHHTPATLSFELSEAQLHPELCENSQVLYFELFNTGDHSCTFSVCCSNSEYFSVSPHVTTELKGHDSVIVTITVLKNNTNGIRCSDISIHSNSVDTLLTGQVCCAFETVKFVCQQTEKQIVLNTIPRRASAETTISFIDSSSVETVLDVKLDGMDNFSLTGNGDNNYTISFNSSTLTDGEYCAYLQATDACGRSTMKELKVVVRGLQLSSEDIPLCAIPGCYPFSEALMAAKFKIDSLAKAPLTIFWKQDNGEWKDTQPEQISVNHDSTIIYLKVVDATGNDGSTSFTLLKSESPIIHVLDDSVSVCSNSCINFNTLFFIESNLPYTQEVFDSEMIEHKNFLQISDRTEFIDIYAENSSGCRDNARIYINTIKQNTVHDNVSACKGSSLAISIKDIVVIPVSDDITVEWSSDADNVAVDQGKDPSTVYIGKIPEDSFLLTANMTVGKGCRFTCYSCLVDVMPLLHLSQDNVKSYKKVHPQRERDSILLLEYSGDYLASSQWIVPDKKIESKGCSILIDPDSVTFPFDAFFIGVNEHNCKDTLKYRINKMMLDTLVSVDEPIVHIRGCKIYPNPVIDNKLVLEYSAIESVIATVFDEMGSKMDVFLLNPSEKLYSLDISSYTSGVYYIKFSGQKEVLSFIKI